MKRVMVWIGMLALVGSLAVPAAAQQTPYPAAPAAPATSAAPAAPAKPATPAKRMTAVGHVKSAAADSLVVLVGKAQHEETFVVDPTTKITKGGKPAAVSDLAANDSVRVSYTEADGKMVAKTVRVRTGKVAAKPATGAAPQAQPKTTP
jgi:Domain of unknown function (DUF5666)